jgi:hypothetical protein
MVILDRLIQFLIDVFFNYLFFWIPLAVITVILAKMRFFKNWLRIPSPTDNYLNTDSEHFVSDRSLRSAVWERDKHTCVECGSKKGVSLTYIIPKSEGGRENESNLRVLCKKCWKRLYL